jgi:phospholipid transport system substrate-binding protein
MNHASARVVRCDMRPRLLSSLVVLCLAFLGPASSVSASTEGGDGARATLEHALSRIDALLDADADSAKLEAEVDALLDYGWLSEAALGGPAHHAQRCAPRCDEFEALLTELIRHNYLQRLAERDRGQVEFVAEDVRKRATKVDTLVRYTGADGRRMRLEVDYVLHQTARGWQVRDIITEDVSLVKNYRYELAKLHAHGGIDEVIATLSEKLAELEAE